MGLPARSNMRPSTSLPTGTEMGAPVPRATEAAREALGGFHGDAAGYAVAHMQEALGEDLGPVLALDLYRVEDGRQASSLESQVEDGPRHSHYCSDALGHIFSLNRGSFKTLNLPGRRPRRRSPTLRSLSPPDAPGCSTS